MKRKRFSVEQIVAVLKQAELGAPVADLIRHLGIAEQTFYRWKRRDAGLESEQVREFKQLQEENAKLKRLVADLSLDKVMLQDVFAKKWYGPRSGAPVGPSVVRGPRIGIEVIAILLRPSGSGSPTSPELALAMAIARFGCS